MFCCVIWVNIVYFFIIYFFLYKILFICFNVIEEVDLGEIVNLLFFGNGYVFCLCIEIWILVFGVRVDMYLFCWILNFKVKFGRKKIF